MTPKPSRREVAKAKTRAKILATAKRLWEKPGTYEAMTIRAITSAAGYSTGALFMCWPDKASLWREAMGYEPPVDCAAVREALRAAAS